MKRGRTVGTMLPVPCRLRQAQAALSPQRRTNCQMRRSLGGKKEESRESDVHGDLTGEAPHDTEDGGLAGEVLDEEEIREDGEGTEVGGGGVDGADGVDGKAGEQGCEDGGNGERIDAEDTPDVEVEDVGLALERPHEDEAGVDEEEGDADETELVELPAADGLMVKHEGVVVCENEEDGEGAQEVQVVKISHRRWRGRALLRGSGGAELPKHSIRGWWRLMASSGESGDQSSGRRCAGASA